MELTPDIKQFKKCHLMVIGDLMLDRYMWGNVERISPEAPVPIFHIRKNSLVAGGAGNVVFNLVGLGCKVSVIGVIGDDESGLQMQKLLDHEKIQNLSIMNSEQTTITKTRIIANGQQLMRLDDEEIKPLNSSISKRVLQMIDEHINDLNAIIISDYGKGVFQTPDLTQSVISMAGKADIPVFIDPKGKDWKRYSGATCVTPNTKELELVYGDTIDDDDDLTTAMHKVMEDHDLSYFLVTRGPKGMCLMARDGSPQFIAAQALEVWDVSGAGDTVISTFAVGVASKMTFSDAAQLANVAAGVVVGKLGTHPINLVELEMPLRMSINSVNGKYSTKLISMDAAQVQTQSWKSVGEKVIFTNGCFDLLHPGHIHLLNEAKALGHRLVVGLNADTSVTRLKGPERPVLNEHDRASILGSLSCVDLIVIFSEDTPEKLILKLQPDILAKGKDYRIEEVVGRDIVESYGGQVRLINILEGYSTTNIAKKIKGSERSEY